MRRIHLCSGIPASGKTTYTENLEKGNPCVIAVHRDVMRDCIREAFESEDYFPVSADIEYECWIDLCASMIQKCPNVYDFWFDQTTLGDNAAAKFINALYHALKVMQIDLLDFEVCIDRFDISLEKALARNAERTGFARVPEDTLISMARSKPPKPSLRKRLNFPNAEKLHLTFTFRGDDNDLFPFRHAL